jgi:CHAT domain-containing protein/Tfp pilus assembly protein PilF
MMKSHDPRFLARRRGRAVAPRIVGLFVRPVLLLLLSTVGTGLAAQSTESRRVGRVAPEVVQLTPGKTIGRVLSGGRYHEYIVLAAAGQFLRVEVMQRGIDVELTLFGPGGRELFKADSPNAADGVEVAVAVAEESGVYRLRVSSGDGRAPAGRYEVTVKELRGALPRDGDRVAAERAFMEATPFAIQVAEKARRTAVAKYNESLAFRRGLSDPSGEARTLYNAAVIYVYLNEHDNAFDYYGRALSLYREAKERQGEAKTLSALGWLHDSRGELPVAFDCFERALPIYRELKDLAGQARALLDLGAVHYKRGETQKGLDRYEQALSLYVEALRVRPTAEVRQMLALTHNNIGAAYGVWGETERALYHLNKALRMSERLAFPLGQAEAHANLGSTYNVTGRKQEALEHLNTALELFRALKIVGGDQVLSFTAGEAKTLNNIGTVYATLNDPDTALFYYRQALAIYSTPGGSSDRDRAHVLNNIGEAYELKFEATHELKKELDEALGYYEQASEINLRLDNRSGQATTLHNIGRVYYLKEEPRRALEYFQQALSIDRELKNSPGMAVALNSLGQAAGGLPEEKDRALGYYEQARVIFERLGDRPNQATVLGNVGSFYEGEGDKLKALDAYLKGIKQLELSRASMTVEEIKAALAEPSAFAAKAALLLIGMGRGREAFDLIELARARTFLDRLGNVRPNIFHTKDTRLVREEQELSAELAALQRNLRQKRGDQGAAPGEVSSAEAEYAAAQHRYELLLTRLKLANPEYASLRSVKTLKLPEIQQQLTEDITLLSYFVMGEKTLAFVITRDSFHAVEIPVKENDMIALIRWFRRFASPADLGTTTMKQLHDWLLTPVEPYIRTRTVGIIPHRLLHYVPFAALTDGRRYFSEDHTLFYLPSASVLRFVREKSRPARPPLLALAQSEADGLPYLPYADDEAEAVARLYGTRALTTAEASQSSFLRRAGEAGIIHIAAHAELDTDSPLFYHISLGRHRDDDGILEVREVYNLNLPKVGLVVLSACRTQVGLPSQGDDIVALNRAFIYAGAPTVIASLWSVEDESARELMISFYKHLKGGMSKAEALGAAQDETRRTHPNPYYWAAFVLTGDPGLPPARATGRNGK